MKKPWVAAIVVFAIFVVVNAIAGALFLGDVSALLVGGGAVGAAFAIFAYKRTAARHSGRPMS